MFRLPELGLLVASAMIAMLLSGCAGELCVNYKEISTSTTTNTMAQSTWSEILKSALISKEDKR